MRYSRSHIVILSLVLEGALAIIFFAWAYYRNYFFPLLPNLHELQLGLLCSLPIFAVNFVIFGPLSHRVSFLNSCFDFKDKIVKPLAHELEYGTSLVVAFCAGFGEELFFRGVIQSELGIFISSITFSLLHFGPAIKKYVFIAALYAVIGFYFGWLEQVFNGLWIPIIAHVTYDYIALIYMRYFYETPRNAVSSSV